MTDADAHQVELRNDGDALTEGEDIRFTGIPSFAPEMLQKVRPDDPMRAKHLGKALQQLAEEGAARD